MLFVVEFMHQNIIRSLNSFLIKKCLFETVRSFRIRWMLFVIDVLKIQAVKVGVKVNVGGVVNVDRLIWNLSMHVIVCTAYSYRGEFCSSRSVPLGLPRSPKLSTTVYSRSPRKTYRQYDLRSGSQRFWPTLNFRLTILRLCLDPT